jgi:hypothetical protein
MLRKLTDLTGFTIGALDGDIGKVHDFYFDDQTWAVRYLIADTGPWLFGRRVLISPVVVDKPLWEARVLPVDLTKEQIEHSPDVNLEQPVSHQQEIELHRHYGWPQYWSEGAMMGTVMPQISATAAANAARYDTQTAVAAEEETIEVAATGERHLRSVKDVAGYVLHATDGKIGHIDDFFASETDWIIRYLLVDTQNWLPGRKVLISPEWVEQIDWADHEVNVKVTRAQIKDSPEYKPQGTLPRDYESDLHAYYGYPPYWTGV